MVPAAEIEKAGARSACFEEVLKNADVLTLHCPSTAQTRRLMNRETFAKLKPGAIFINVGRGDLADPDALTDALQNGRLGAAALDVFDPEPIPAGHPDSHTAECHPRAAHCVVQYAGGNEAAGIGGEARHRRRPWSTAADHRQWCSTLKTRLASSNAA